MPESEHSGLVQTVLGPVLPDSLGATSTHEHLLINFLCMFNPPAEASNLKRAYEPISISNLGWVRRNWLNHHDNLQMLDEAEAIEEALLFKRAGGGTLVDATTIGIGRDPNALARIARATGLNIVMGTGFYVDAALPPETAGRSVDDLARQMIDEIQTGVGATGVRAGIIGELGCSWPLNEIERKVLQAAAKTQAVTGATILVHPGRSTRAPGEILDVLADAGADLGRTIMAHLDRTLADLDDILQIARRGCYLEYDLFGLESSYYPLGSVDMLSDAQRIEFIRRLIAEGYLDRIVIAQDICSKHRLVRYGGHGFAHILESIAPWMRETGMLQSEVDAILVENPARALTFV